MVTQKYDNFLFYVYSWKIKKHWHGYQRDSLLHDHDGKLELINIKILHWNKYGIEFNLE